MLPVSPVPEISTVPSIRMHPSRQTVRQKDRHTRMYTYLFSEIHGSLFLTFLISAAETSHKFGFKMSHFISKHDVHMKVFYIALLKCLQL